MSKNTSTKGGSLLLNGCLLALTAQMATSSTPNPFWLPLHPGT
jgi:hypothetical protein